MNTILIIGAGRSSTALINYLLERSCKAGWKLIVADRELSLAEDRIDWHHCGSAMELDINNIDERRSLINRADLVVSMLPAHLHLDVARDCLEYGKHLITASYVSSEMHKLAVEARKRGLVFMGEMGLDPGIDHMSAMEKIDEIKAAGGKIHSFRSYTGGLIADESDDNPWHYKFTWNPRNVILAGQGTAQYLKNGKFKYIPYHRLFARRKEVEIQGKGTYEMYPNRDSLLYRYAYKIEDIPTIIRGTLRHQGYCDAWDVFIKIGLTDDTYPIVNSGELTYRELVEAYLQDESGLSLEDRIAKLAGVEVDSEVMEKIKWTGILSDQKIGLDNATPAKILEHLLLKKWKLQPEDKDMIIMQHEFIYTLQGEKLKVTSTMVLKGNDAQDTAMSKLVGLPMGIFVKLLMEGTSFKGNESIPVNKDIYQPILEELEGHGVVFKEKLEKI